MANGYPDNLPAYVPPPAAPASTGNPPAGATAPKSTYDTIKDRASDLMTKVDSIVRGTHNPANNLPPEAFKR